MKHKCTPQLLLWIQTKQKHRLQTERSCMHSFRPRVCWKLIYTSPPQHWWSHCNTKFSWEIFWFGFPLDVIKSNGTRATLLKVFIRSQRIYDYLPGARCQRTIPRCLVSMHQPVGAFLEVQGNVLSIRQMALKLWFIIVLKYPLHLLPNS